KPWAYKSWRRPLQERRPLNQPGQFAPGSPWGSSWVQPAGGDGEATMTSRSDTAARCAALVGPYTSGKTTLLEALLLQAGALHRKGAVTEGSSLGDSSPEARAHQMT